MKYTKIIAISSIFFPAFLFASGPEKYDHMRKYKEQSVIQQGPSNEVAFDKKGKKIASATYKYNKNGQLIESLYNKDQKSDGRSEYTYKDNNLKVETLYSKDDKVIEKILYSYNRQNEIRGYSVKDDQGKEVLRWKFNYSRKKLMSGKRVIKRELTEKFTVGYHKNGKIVREIFSSTGEKVGTIFSNWSNHKLIQRTKKDTTGVYKIYYHYNDKQQLVKMTFYNTVHGKLELSKTHKFTYGSVEKISHDHKADYTPKKEATLVRE